jgi:hypothetical protein
LVDIPRSVIRFESFLILLRLGSLSAIVSDSPHRYK